PGRSYRNMFRNQFHLSLVTSPFIAAKLNNLGASENVGDLYRLQSTVLTAVTKDLVISPGSTIRALATPLRE
ncbi:hypothetical protein, partial [Novosphingobium resinovorum]|uniref:hypothetical protein n=1 Tax=Novosphingobium resinovorum TaxID=158500 RepID=UPI002ED4B175|nr:hypothetical protein [Novosphingobium resinovorum]